MANYQGQLEPYHFKPGQSGNPGGRPKGTLKDFQRQQFMSMSDADKAAFLNDLPKDIRWRMAEGNPAQEQQVSGTVEIKLADLYDERTDTTQPEA